MANHNNLADRYVNICKNSGFKAVFGDEDNKEVIISIINTLLQGKRKVTDITFLRTEYQSTDIKGKEFRYDFMCRDQSGTTFIVEMQCYPEVFWFKRVVSYVSRAYDRSLKSGDGYDVPPVYFFGFMNTDVQHEANEYWERNWMAEYTFLEKHTQELLDETIFITFAELKRFRLKEAECTTPLERLLYLMKHSSSFSDRLPAWARDRIWQDFMRSCEIAAFSEQKRIEYEQDMYDERRHMGEMLAATRIGLEEGLEKGREEGRAEGVAIGREEGREEKKLEIAKKMKEDGLSVEIISRYSGLTAEVIESL